MIIKSTVTDRIYWTSEGRVMSSEEEDPSAETLSTVLLEW